MLKKPDKADKKIVNFRIEKNAWEWLQKKAKKEKTQASKIIYDVVWDYIEKVSSLE